MEGFRVFGRVLGKLRRVKQWLGEFGRVLGEFRRVWESLGEFRRV